MWIFTPLGFFSVVTDRNNPNRLLVRTRARKDLDDFRSMYCRRMGPTIDRKKLGHGSDYPFRAFVGKKAFANAMTRVIKEMTYGNFKSSVKDNTRHGVYMDVWSTMSAAERAGKLNGTYKSPSYSSRGDGRWWEEEDKVSSLTGSESMRQTSLFGTYKGSNGVNTREELEDAGYSREQIEDPFYVDDGFVSRSKSNDDWEEDDQFVGDNEDNEAAFDIQLAVDGGAEGKALGDAAECPKDAMSFDNLESLCKYFANPEEDEPVEDKA